MCVRSEAGAGTGHAWIAVLVPAPSAQPSGARPPWICLILGFAVCAHTVEIRGLLAAVPWLCPPPFPPNFPPVGMGGRDFGTPFFPPFSERNHIFYSKAKHKISSFKSSTVLKGKQANFEGVVFLPTGPSEVQRELDLNSPRNGMNKAMGRVSLTSPPDLRLYNFISLIFYVYSSLIHNCPKLKAGIK